MKIVILENPGMGNCLFHAIAFGIVSAIQTLNKTDVEKAQELWNDWAELGGLEEALAFEEILKIDIHSRPKTETALKAKLQNSLRTIAAEALRNRSQFLFDAQYKPQAKSYQVMKSQLSLYNEKLQEFDKVFAEVKAQEAPAYALQAIVNEIRKNNHYKWTKDALEADAERKKLLKNLQETPESQKLQQLMKLEALTETRNLRSLLSQNQIERDPLYVHFKSMYEHFKIYGRTPFKDQHNLFYNCKAVVNLAKKFARKVDAEQLISEISLAEHREILMAGLAQIKVRDHWGTAEHAAAIFRVLRVNSNILTANERVVAPDMSFGEDAPLICLVNIENVHWVTGLSIINGEKSKPNEIVEMFQSCPTKGGQDAIFRYTLTPGRTRRKTETKSEPVIPKRKRTNTTVEEEVSKKPVPQEPRELNLPPFFNERPRDDRPVNESGTGTHKSNNGQTHVQNHNGFFEKVSSKVFKEELQSNLARVDGDLQNLGF